MPFIAIAFALSLMLGGGAVVASQTDAGESVVEGAAEVWSEAKANLNTEGEVFIGSYRETEEDEADVETNTDTDIQAEARANAEAKTKAETALKADTSLNVDANLSL